MKIQEVIDEVNNTWGEEHEEKRKKIFRENIFWKPLGVFRDVSLFYLFATFVFGFSICLAPDSKVLQTYFHLHMYSIFHITFLMCVPELLLLWLVSF